MSTLLALDPGPVRTAWVLYDTDERTVLGWAHDPNEYVLTVVANAAASGRALAIEMIASYGMPVGAEVFETCVWIGRFGERYYAEDGQSVRRVYRREVKTHLCGSMKAKDANVRQALIDKFGPGKELAIGRKQSPGPLFGLSGDGWAALGVAVTAAETSFQPALA